MTERLRAALASYAQSPNARSGAVLCLISVAAFGFGLDHRPPLAQFFIGWGRLLFALAGVGIVSGQLYHQFACYRARLLPNYAAPHAAVALALGALLALAAAGTTTSAFLETGDPAAGRPGTSFIGAVAAFWFVGLLLYGLILYAWTAVLVRPRMFQWILLGSLAALGGVHFLWGAAAALSSAERIWRPEAAPVLLVVDGILTTLVLWRLLGLHEESLEYGLKRFDPLHKDYRSWKIVDALPGRRTVDRLNALASFRDYGLSGRLKLFLLTAGFRPIPVVGVLLIVVLVRAILGDRVVVPIVVGLVLGGMLGPLFLSSLTDRSAWLFLLPLGRRDLFLCYWGARLVAALRSWLIVAAIVALAEWVPLPGQPAAGPSVSWLVGSAFALLPALGIAALAFTWNSLKWRIVAPLGIMAALALMSGAQVFVGPSLLAMAAAIMGFALIALAYSFWLRMEFR